MHVVEVQGDGDGGESMEILPGNFEKNTQEIPGPCFVGVAWKFSIPKRYQF